jgi:16S rRNA (adenine1518-N6/adenine1519-N6)-dimethyltransferase
MNRRASASGAGSSGDPGSPAPAGGRGSGEIGGLRQVSLARLAEFGVVPKRDLGQNFLIDDNILGVILGQLNYRPEDVVLEVGAGLGVLTAALAGVARHVHAFEVDRSLEPALRATLSAVPSTDAGAAPGTAPEDGPPLGARATPGAGSRVTLHFQDVLRARLEDLAPVPTLCASNPPYSVAGPFLIECLQRIPTIRRYCVMVQREVAERMAAPPGTKTYGVLSVWVQLYAKIVRTRPLARSIFHPQPNVDSTLIVLDRLPEEQLPSLKPERLREVIQAAFGQRRKTLVNSLSAGLGISREKALQLTVSLGLSADIRAERLEPGQFVELAERAYGTAEE